MYLAPLLDVVYDTYVTVLLCAQVVKPIQLYEVKKIVGMSLSQVDSHDLAQTLVQGYYVLYEHAIPNVIVTLTDGLVFHFFGVEKQPPDVSMTTMTI